MAEKIVQFSEKLGKKIRFDPSKYSFEAAEVKALGETSPDLFSQIIGEDQPLSVIEQVDENKDSPVSLLDRLKMSFGNPEDKLSYLAKKNLEPRIRDGQLYTKDENGSLIPVDPAAPSFMKFLKDIPADIAEFAGDVPEIAGDVAGSVAGLSIAGPAGLVGGAGVGGFTGNKFKQAIGSLLGVRNQPPVLDVNSKGFFDPESMTSGGLSALTSLIPAGGQVLKSGSKKAANVIASEAIPERIYAWSTGLTKGSKEEAQSLARALLDENITGTSKSLTKKAIEKGTQSQSVLKDILEKSAPIKQDAIETKFKSLLGKPATGDIKAHNKAVDSVWKEFKQKYFPGKSLASATTLNEEKKLLQGAASKQFGEPQFASMKKDAQRALSTALKQSIEEASGSPESVKAVNKAINRYFSLVESLNEKSVTEFGKPVFSGVDAFVGSLGGAQSVAAKKAVELSLKIPGVATPTAKLLDTVTKKIAGKQVSKPSTTMLLKVIADAAGLKEIDSDKMFNAESNVGVNKKQSVKKEDKISSDLGSFIGLEN